MSKLPEKRKKYSLVFATVVAFCSVCTAGVSTFAWFQAQANVSISATNSSTTITVRSPKDYIFYGYNGNVAADWTNKGESFEDDFTMISSSNTTAKTHFTGEDGAANKFNPGDVKAFAIKFFQHTSGDNVSLKINKLISNTINNQNASKQSTKKTWKTI